MATQTYAFSGGRNEVPPYGDRWQIGFSGTWVFGDYWSLAVTSSEGDLTLGVGNLHALTPTVCFTYRNREYLGMGTQFNFSANGDVTEWEEQASGTGFVAYLSNFGTQDTITALNQLQGRLAVIGKLSAQIWTVDADPNLFTLVQTLDNIGTEAPLSVQNLGDFDVLFLDPTGVRSLRAREVTLNADVDDVGLAIDSLVQAAQVGFDASGSCSIVEPTSKRYWLFVKDTIYVLSRYRSSKISAWATYLPTYQANAAVLVPPTFAGDSSAIIVYGLTTGAQYKLTIGNAASVLLGNGDTLIANGYFVAPSANVTIFGTLGVDWTGHIEGTYMFTPEKFVVHNKKVYCRSTERLLLVYGGSDGNTYDRTVATLKTPWLDDRKPATLKQGQGIDIAMLGAWLLKAGTDPISGLLADVYESGDGDDPDENSDSSFDTGRKPFESVGTHFQLEAVSSNESSKAAKISSVIYHFNLGTTE